MIWLKSQDSIEETSSVTPAIQLRTSGTENSPRNSPVARSLKPSMASSYRAAGVPLARVERGIDVHDDSRAAGRGLQDSIKVNIGAVEILACGQRGHQIMPGDWLPLK